MTTRGEATIAEEAPPTQLTLADSDDTGLDVDAKALLVASAPGTAGSDPYADSDRGGTDTPLDGELGLSATNTVISRFRRLVAAELTLNDNDSPAALDIGAYFNAGGDGADLTIYLQTLDGAVSFTAAAQYVLGGGGFARFTLPADAQTLLDNLASGDRWIFKAARPATATPTDQPITAGSRHDTRNETTVTEEAIGQRVSFFDASVVGDYDDPEVSNSTPGCVLTFTPGVDTNTPVLGSSAARRPPRRIPPSYVTGTVDAFWATVQMQAAVLVIRTSISQTSPGSESGPDLTPTAESTVGVALRAETGETISFLLSELNDSTEPYQRNLDNNSGSDPAFDTAPVSTFSGAEYTACRDAFISGGGSVVIVDTAHANVDWDALEFGESPDPAADQTVTAEGRHDTRRQDNHHGGCSGSGSSHRPAHHRRGPTRDQGRGVYYRRDTLADACYRPDRHCRGAPRHQRRGHGLPRRYRPRQTSSSPRRAATRRGVPPLLSIGSSVRFGTGGRSRSRRRSAATTWTWPLTSGASSRAG